MMKPADAGEGVAGQEGTMSETKVMTRREQLLRWANALQPLHTQNMSGEKVYAEIKRIEEELRVEASRTQD